MAESISAWGIDIGQAGLKAIRLRSSENGERVVATAFDYVPHPKILSQPDAIPEELIREAMKTFVRVQAAKRLAALGGTVPNMPDVPRRGSDTATP